MLGTDTDAFVAGLRELADFYEQHPDLPNPVIGGEEKLLVPMQTRAALVEVIRAIGSGEKRYVEDWFHFERRFGPLTLSFYVGRSEVCRRIVVGTERVPAQEAHEREIVEWVCDEPLLAERAEKANV